MSFKLDCMKFKPLLLRFVHVRDECFWQIAARALTDDIRKLKLMCYSNTFSNKKFPYFLPFYGFQKIYNCSVFSKNNTWLLLVPSTSPKYFVIHLKLTWSTLNFCIKKFVTLMASWERGYQKSAKIFKKTWFRAMISSDAR